MRIPLMRRVYPPMQTVHVCKADSVTGHPCADHPFSHLQRSAVHQQNQRAIGLTMLETYHSGSGAVRGARE